MTLPINKYKYFLHYEDRARCRPFKGGRFGSWEEARNFRVSIVASQQYTSYHEVIELPTNYPSPGTPLFVTVIRYSTGNTFGISTGHGKIVGLHLNYQDAVKQKAELEKENWDSCMGTGALYKSWTGYFETVTDIEIITVGFTG